MTNYHTKWYGTESPYRCIFRDHTQTDERAMLHGHAIRVSVVFGRKETVAEKDFLHFIATQTAWIDEYLGELFGNTVLVSRKDPLANVIIILERENMVDVRLMDDVSFAGLNKMMLEDFDKIVSDQTLGKIAVEMVTAYEAEYA